MADRLDLFYRKYLHYLNHSGIKRGRHKTSGENDMIYRVSWTKRNGIQRTLATSDITEAASQALHLNCERIPYTTCVDVVDKLNEMLTDSSNKGIEFDSATMWRIA